MSLFIKNKLGAKSAINFDISNACAGMITGAYILDSMIKAGVVKNGMIVSGESNTTVADTALREIKDPLDKQFASLTVGDAGAAFILDEAPNEEEGINFVDFVSFAKYADLCFAMPSDQTKGWAMYAEGREIHKAAISRMPLVIANVYKKNGLEFNPDNYDFVIVHQTSERAIHSFLDTSRDFFSKDMPEPLFSLHEYGNTSSTTHFVALYKGLKEKKVKKGSRILFVVAASGLGIGCLSSTIGNLKV
jgi:3-oxoacyl-[acyl-carrier-protein] synthase-3